MIYSQAAAAAAHLYLAAAITISILAVALAATAIIIALSIHNERRCNQYGRSISGNPRDHRVRGHRAVYRRPHQDIMPAKVMQYVKPRYGHLSSRRRGTGGLQKAFSM